MFSAFQLGQHEIVNEVVALEFGVDRRVDLCWDTARSGANRAPGSEY